MSNVNQKRQIDWDRLWRESDTKTAKHWAQEFGCSREMLYYRGRPPKGFKPANGDRRRRAIERLKAEGPQRTPAEWARILPYSRNAIAHCLAKAAGVKLKMGRSGPKRKQPPPGFLDDPWGKSARQWSDIAGCSPSTVVRWRNEVRQEAE